jgi:hypothetical protein
MVIPPAVRPNSAVKCSASGDPIDTPPELDDCAPALLAAFGAGAPLDPELGAVAVWAAGEEEWLDTA